MSGDSIKLNSARDISSVITAHMAWKRRIQAEIDGKSDDTLSIATIMADNLCVLGKWIYNEGEKAFATDPDFIELRTIHAHFHKVTATTLEMAKKGQADEAQAIISTGEFAAVSKQVVNLLTVLYKRNK